MAKPKTPTRQAPQASTEAVEGIRQESNTKVASKPKQANTTAKKASTGGRRGRPKKVVVDKITEDALASPPIKLTYKYDPKWDEEPKPSLYRRFKDWLVFKLYHYTSYFKGY